MRRVVQNHETPCLPMGDRKGEKMGNERAVRVFVREWRTERRAQGGKSFLFFAGGAENCGNISTCIQAAFLIKYMGNHRLRYCSS